MTPRRENSLTNKAKSKIIAVEGLTLEVPLQWEDVTREMSPSGYPITLANPNEDVGALQFSIAQYKSGKIPNPTTKDLMSMLREFGLREQLGEPMNIAVSEGQPKYARASFRSKGDFVCAWYVSDGRSFALVTYVCEWKDRNIQFDTCQGIVEKLAFRS
jgi:hypothetical protein